MSILNEIVLKKKERLENVKTKVSLKDLRSKIANIEKPKDFEGAIKRTPNEKVKLIAEIKKASPLKGIIRKDFNHLSIARIYEQEDVHAISVITEEDFFLGSLSFLAEIRKILTKPLLRKDFIFDEYQIYESRANEADAILLIAAILEKNQAAEYLHLSKELGLSVIFEVSNFKELEMALYIDSNIIGINNRDLKTLNIDINTTLELKKEIPSNKVIISESGIKTKDDVKRLDEAGIHAILVGTTFMEAEDIVIKIRELMADK